MNDLKTDTGPAHKACSKRISVIVPSLNRPNEVKQLFADLAAQSVQNFEVLVIVQGNVAPEAYLGPNAIGDDGYRVFKLEACNASLARNIGLREARADIVLFLDDDVRISNPDFLRNHLRHYDDASTSGVYGQVLEVGEAPTDAPEPDAINSDWGWMKLPANYALPCRTRNGASNNLSVRRNWALAVGGMDAWFEKGARREETEFNLRYTKRFGLLVFDPEAGLTHLSADGGSRSWGHVRRTVPMHHVVGHWYFLMRAIRDRTLGLFGLVLETRHIANALLKNPQSGRNPLIFVGNLSRAMWGLAIALGRLIRGPRRLETITPSSCRELDAERTTY